MPTLGDILSSADFFLYDIVGVTSANQGFVEACFVKTSKESYEQASFLKIGEFNHGDVNFRIDLSLIMEAMAAEESGGVVHHIFNTGFCCSTLLARALGATGPFLVLREAGIMDVLNRLRTRFDLNDPQALQSWRNLLRVVIFLLGRTYAGMACTIAKADEFSGRMQHDLLLTDKRSKALFLYSPLSEFLPSILKSPERRAYAHEKLRLHEGDVGFLSPFSNRATLTDAEAATLGWLYEQYNYLKLVSSFGNSRIGSVRAEEFLHAPALVLTRLAEWFGTRIAIQTAEDVANGPIMRSHSKAPDQRFDAIARKDELRSVGGTLEAEIRAGLHFADVITRDYPLPANLPSGVMNTSKRN
ncbi:MAG: hypothetical protein AMXMBFR59_40750 [Rhodanobacteraceae bacterium]